MLKRPPATTSPFGRDFRANTTSFMYRPANPEPSADHVEPFHRAMRLALTAPATVNAPPATTSPLGSTVSAPTPEFSPMPMDDHVAPSHRAIRFAGRPPAVLNMPPATR